jgi:hypothetical protein
VTKHPPHLRHVPTHSHGVRVSPKSTPTIRI